MSSKYDEYIYLKYKYIQLKKSLQNGGSNTFTITIKQPWFDLIKNGRKTVEGRLNSGLFSKLRIGDKIKWIHKKLIHETTIIFLHKYKSFKDMLEAETMEKTLPTINDISKGVAIYRQYYSEDKEKKGVIALGLASKVHEGGLSDPHFENIKNGSKIYETRVYDDKRKGMNINDIWIFKHNDSAGNPLKDNKVVVTKIIEKALFESFYDALDDAGYKKVLPNVNSIKEGVSLYESFPGYKDGAKKDGVVRFRLEVIN
jgi:ASC-1-like (ASCH) protein